MSHAVPGATLVEQALSGESPGLPSLVKEPAKLIGNVVASLLALFTALSALAVFFTDAAPESMRDELGFIIAGIGVIVTALTKAQAWFTRQKVWSPESTARAVKQALYTQPPAEAVLPHVTDAAAALGDGTPFEEAAPPDDVPQDKPATTTRRRR